MNEQERELQDQFGNDYSPPVSNDWEEWVEIKLSRQGTIIVGLGVGLAVTLLLTSLNGKLVVNLVKSQREIIETLNTITGGGRSADTRSVDVPQADSTYAKTGVKYAQPEKSVNESAIAPADPTLLAELREKMAATGAEPPREIM